MSLELNWDLLTEEHSTLAKDFLNEKLKTSLPAAAIAGLGNVVIHDLDLGDRAPTIELIDISDPFDGMANPELCDHKDREDFDERQFYREDTARLATVASDPDCVQIRVRVAYQGSAVLRVSADVQVNAPSPAFVSLPVELTTRALHFDVEIIAYVRENRDIRISLLHSIKHNSPLVDVSFDANLGDENQSVLRNVEKIQNFIVVATRTLMAKYLMYPRSLVFPFTFDSITDTAAAAEG